MPGTKKGRSKKPQKKTQGKLVKNKDEVPLYLYNGFPFPHAAVVNMRMVVRHKLTQVAQNVPIYHKFNMATVYQPDTLTLATRPMGWNQVSGVYNHFTVLSARVTTQFSMISAGADSTANSVIVGIITNDDSTICGDNFERIAENGLTNYFLLSDIKDRVTMTKSYSLAKYHGKGFENDDKFRGTVISNPSEETIFAPFAVCADPLLAAGWSPIDCITTIDYKVRWYERGDMLRGV